MDRNFLRSRWCWCLLAAGALAVATQIGCVQALATAVYLVKGTNVPADFVGLREKRVAIVCRPMADAGFGVGTFGADEELAKEVGRLLEINDRKIKEVIDHRKVAEWTDEHNWDDFTEIGDALGADMVVGIDLDAFNLYQSQTLYQGKATLSLRVYDIQQGGKVVYQKTALQSTWPPNTGIYTQEMSEHQFRQRFIGVLGDLVGRNFYAHDDRADFAADSAAL